MAETSVLVNGCPTKEFNSARGLRQGDLLSPFLFLIAEEGLNAMINATVDARLFTEFSGGTNDVIPITHL